MTTPAFDSSLTLATLADLPAILAVQKGAYGSELLESEASFASKIKASPETCFVIKNGACISAYLITLPCSKETLPDFDAPTFSVPKNPDFLYIQDLAISQDGKGKGYGKQLVNHALSVAIGISLPSAYLVAVQDSSNFWAKFGFTPVEKLDPIISKKLASYTGEPVFMTKQLIDPAYELAQEKINP